MKKSFTGKNSRQLFATLGIIVILSSMSQINLVNAQTDDSWYLGKGAKQGMYLRYTVVDNSNQTIPTSIYDMIIYFENYDNNSKTWTAPIFVVPSNDTVINGTFVFGGSQLSFNPSDKSIIPSQFEPYKTEYLDTLFSLAPFASSPVSLDSKQWTSVSQISETADLTPDQVITIPAGTYHCTMIAHKSSQEWVFKDLPYPVKGMDDVRGYELTQIGYGYPSVPEFPASIIVIAALSLAGLVIMSHSGNFKRLRYF